MDLEKIKVAVAMSGGVDSSAAAYLLLEKGYNIIGITMKLYDEYDEKNNIIESSYIEDARVICNLLGIEHVVLDLREAFEENVIKYFCDEYLAGRTPNPCAICNRVIKYGLLYEESKEYGATHIATGHYCNIIFDDKINRYRVKKGAIGRKDQSYLFSLLSQEQLSKIILPLGEFESKEIVKNIVREIYPKVAMKKESNDICFIEEKKYGNFIRKRVLYRNFEGNFIDEHGNKLGKHKGIFNYTIGQRRGLLNNLNKPMYVIEIDPENNNITLGDEVKLYSNGFIGKKCNFTLFDKLNEPICVDVKICQWGYLLSGTVIPGDNKDEVIVTFTKPQRAVAPGQIGVFYVGTSEVIGGCIIDSTT